MRCCRLRLRLHIFSESEAANATGMAGSLHFFGFGFGVCLAAARQHSTQAPFSQTGPKSRLVPPKVERPLAPPLPNPRNFGQHRCWITGATTRHPQTGRVTSSHGHTLGESPSLCSPSAYLLLGPAGLLEHHPGDVGSLRVGHGGFGQVALLEARLALTAQQSATESRPRHRSQQASKQQQQAQSARSADRSSESGKNAQHTLLLCMTSAGEESSLVLGMHVGWGAGD